MLDSTARNAELSVQGPALSVLLSVDVKKKNPVKLKQSVSKLIEALLEAGNREGEGKDRWSQVQVI